MSKNTIKQLAAIVGTSVDHFINQLKQAGVEVSNEEQTLSEKETEQLRTYLLEQKTSGKPILDQQPVATKRTSTEALKLKGRKTQSTVSITVKKRKATYIQHPSIQIETKEVKPEEISPELLPDTSEITLTPPPPSSTPTEQVDEITSPKKPNEESAEASHHRYKKEKEKEKKLKPLHSKQKRNDFYHLREQSSESSANKAFRSKPPKRKKEGLKQEFERPTTPIVREVMVPEAVTVTELAQKMSVKVSEVIKKLMKLGVLATATQTLEQETASILVEEMGHIAKPITSDTLELDLQTSTLQHKNRGKPITRPPVITIMGHVDHGKTSLLDYIRRTKVASGEAGGITQHIGAYHVELPKGMITFLDTPGHAAFTAMRARGARLTDIVALIVAADDGVMPQTIEAIEHAQAANVPIVVAVNKMDKPNADLDRIQQELANYKLIPESWGGETLFVPVSAKTGLGVDNLLEALLIQAEMLELKAPIAGPAQGIIIESRLDKGRGPVATILVQQGLLSKGDILLAGTAFGRIRALYDESGAIVSSAGPSIPVEILGLSNVATAGDEAIVVPTERKAREAALFRSAIAREYKMKRLTKNKEDGLMSQLDAHARKSLNIVLKADVQGSAEVLRDSLIKLSTEEIQVKLLTAGIGAITESDVNLALASKALLLGFNVRANNTAKQIARHENIEIYYHSVIYELLDQIKQVMGGLLTPIIKENILGLAEVREVFRSAKLGTIAGCQVTEDVIKRNCPIRVLRDNIIIHQGELTSLKRFKEDVNEVRAGTECGVAIKNYTDIKVGDMIEVYERITVIRTS